VLLPVDEEDVVVPRDAVTFHGMVSRDPEMLRVFQIVRQVAESEATVLVRGESGTGKELVARALHDLSPRSSGPFVAVNCAAFPRDLLESELFGHVRGAFTGAISDREGIFARANHGTLFLDEVGELPLDLQPKLLRVLETREVTPIGARNTFRVDLRVVAATHRALREEVKAGRFREDLMYRLRVVPVFLPPLRDRRLDVEVLLRAGIERHNVRGPRRISRIHPAAMRALLDHRWPGNVRELQNVLEYAYAVGRGPELMIEDLPPEIRDPAPPAPTTPAEVEAERKRVEDAIREADGDLTAAARALGLSRTTFWRRRKALGFED
jgi:transcriptional regulator with PAS, ATPase and Fis domain